MACGGMSTGSPHPRLPYELILLLHKGPPFMSKKPPQPPDRPGFLAYLAGKTPTRTKLEIRAAITTAYLIAHIQRQSRVKK